MGKICRRSILFIFFFIVKRGLVEHHKDAYGPNRLLPVRVAVVRIGYTGRPYRWWREAE